MATTSQTTVSLETIVSLAKRRGFIFQSSEIYGGLNGCWDYGPLGVELLRNIKESWWRAMTYRDDIEGIDAAILMHPRVWEASGHVQSFSDPMIDNKISKKRYRADHLIEGEIEKLRKKGRTEQADVLEAKLNAAMDPGDFYKIITEHQIQDPETGQAEWTEVRQFNLMFKTHIGPLEESSSAVYLRPETAQGIFVNFTNVLQSSRQKVPFGIAQIGKSFRNEINTKNFLFRTREFEQMEMQFFVKPGEDAKWYDYWREQRWNWFRDLGMQMERLRMKPHEKLAHYARAAVDIEYQFPFGWGELEGIHNRSDFDLGRHTEYSGKKLEYFDQVANERYTPFVIETAVGASRSTMAFLCDAYAEEEVNGEKRNVLRFHPKLAPYKVAVFPLVNRDGMQEFAQKLYGDLQRSFKAFYDDSGAVGRRYRRQDEAGTPFCVTIDGQTLEDGTVTIRHRDTMQQERIPAEGVGSYVGQRIA
ncbi:MAG: glycine--tRNA ligase [Chlorobi bacterium]|nr:MAG: glycyl-tRNA synthetase [Chlorobi bacterium OLB7]MBK8912126.1 glycine--tRNA ligase [Chlorobiota bacterium]MBX7217101.1 glycine--tRNA ligase [Candidatus Kapabacteria bacterium]